MVKLNLTGLQTSDSSEIPVWEQTPENIEETPIAEQSNYSFSLSSLISNTNPTTQETTNTTDTKTQETSILTQPLWEQQMIESLLPIEWMTWKSNNNSEEVISINGNQEGWTTDKTQEDKVWAVSVSNSEPEENKEFFKSFDVIKEFNEEKWDEIVINKWDVKLELITEGDENNKTEGTTIMTNNGENILEGTENITEMAVDQIEEIIIPTTQQINPINSEIKNEMAIETSQESISLNDTTNTTSSINNETTPATDIEQAKKDLSATRKPFWIKSFSKKSVIASLWAVFVCWLVAVGLNQINLLWWKTNIQETIIRETIPVVKYISWTDYTIITNKKKNLRKPREVTLMNTWVEIGTWEQLDNSWLTIMSGSTTSSLTEINSWVTNEQPTSPSDAMMLQPEQGPNQTPRELQWPQWPSNNNTWIPAIQSTNSPANDMNDIANWAN